MALNLDFLPLINIGLTAAFIILAVFFTLITVGGGLFFYHKKVRIYKQFKCVIWKKDDLSGNIIETFDEGGIFVKEGIKGLWLRKHKGIVLNADQIPWIQTKKGKTVYLLHCGLKNMKYIKPSVSDDMLSFNLGEEDINWGIYEYRNSHNLFSEDPGWKQWVPVVGMFFVGVIFLFMIIMVLKKFDVLAEVATKFDHAAMVLQNVV